MIKKIDSKSSKFCNFLKVYYKVFRMFTFQLPEPHMDPLNDLELPEIPKKGQSDDRWGVDPLPTPEI